MSPFLDPNDPLTAGALVHEARDVGPGGYVASPVSAGDGGDCYAVAGRAAIEGIGAEDLRVVHADPPPPPEPCIAGHETMRPGVMRRCARRRWGETPYCYQHAISNGHAIVISPFMLAVAMVRVYGEPSVKHDAVNVWQALVGQKVPR